mmetsp:Transcript_9284/g.29733  ORF Transcript_9284/g.29733 Transcript_9284/m.29733 type:complete len:302 (-) Transcript_9284:423-1328(-)
MLGAAAVVEQVGEVREWARRATAVGAPRRSRPRLAECAHGTARRMPHHCKRHVARARRACASAICAMAQAQQLDECGRARLWHLDQPRAQRRDVVEAAEPGLWPLLLRRERLEGGAESLAWRRRARRVFSRPRGPLASRMAARPARHAAAAVLPLAASLPPFLLALPRAASHDARPAGVALARVTPHPTSASRRQLLQRRAARAEARVQQRLEGGGVALEVALSQGRGVVPVEPGVKVGPARHARSSAGAGLHAAEAGVAAAHHRMGQRGGAALRRHGSEPLRKEAQILRVGLVPDRLAWW